MYSELNTGVSNPVFYGLSALNFPLSAMFIALCFLYFQALFPKDRKATQQA
jgi:hypothetical protein